MGTLQLLLITVGVVVVGIAIVVGTNIFGTNGEQANKDAITQDCLRMVSAAEGYYRKPSLLGGGKYRFDDITMPHLGMVSDESLLEAENLNGRYSIIKAAGSELEIKGVSFHNPESAVIVSLDMNGPLSQRLFVSYEHW